MHIYCDVSLVTSKKKRHTRSISVSPLVSLHKASPAEGKTLLIEGLLECQQSWKIFRVRYRRVSSSPGRYLVRIREDNVGIETCRPRENRRIYTNGEKMTRIWNTEGYGIVQFYKTKKVNCARKQMIPNRPEMWSSIWRPAGPQKAWLKLELQHSIIMAQGIYVLRRL